MDEKEKLEKIKNDLTLEQIESLLSFLGGEPIRQNNIITSKTICHCGQSHKLFYYDNTKLFRCYTECSEIFDVFQLVMKVKATDGAEMALPQALKYITNFFNILDTEGDFFQDRGDETLEDWKILKRYEKSNNQQEREKQIVELKIYDGTILKHLPKPRIGSWEQEGITNQVIKEHNICYNPVSEAIVIPHYDKDNNLVGIRERTLIKENEQYGKYRPTLLNRTMYNHPLGFNLYNLNNSKDNIKRIKKVVVFESEKSCLKYASYFGSENDISVAVCGSSFSSYQFKLLQELGVDEIIIAFDKQYQEIGDKEYLGWIKKLLDISKKFANYCKISFIFDTEDKIGYKDAPIDLTPEIFIYLYQNRLDSLGKK